MKLFRLEIKRTYKGRYLFYILSVLLFSYILGYVLPVGLDHVQHLSYNEYMFSTYTVFTQFGFLLFGFVIVLFFNTDYQMNTILFYKKLHVSSLPYFFNKCLVLSLEFGLGIVLVNTAISFIFKDFSAFLPMSYLLIIVSLQYIFIIGCISLLVKNILLGFVLSLFYWLGSIILVNVNSLFSSIALFDASNKLYQIVEKNLQTGSWQTGILSPIVFLVIIIVLTGTVAKFSGKRWLKLGLA